MKTIAPGQSEQPPDENSIAGFGHGIEGGWHERVTVMNSWARCTKFFWQKLRDLVDPHGANAPVETDAL
jgi:hypothetical protein